MPTAYTASVADGTITELKPFALQCARAMGALILMRDADPDAPIPERFEPNSHCADKLEELTQKLRALRAMTPAERTKAANADYSAKLEAAVAWHAAKDIERARYDAMIEKVEAWEGAPDGLQSFMLEQLRSGRDFDCPPDREYFDKAIHMTGLEWFEAKEAELSRRRVHYAEEAEKEHDRTEARNAWLAQLRASLASMEAVQKGGE